MSTKAKHFGCKRHPLSAFYPVHEGDPLSRLAANIKKHGLQHPIIIYKGWVLDGWRRLMACEKAGVEPEFQEFKGSEEEAADFVEIENLHRRHLGLGDIPLAAIRHRDWLLGLKDSGCKTELIKSLPEKYQISMTTMKRSAKVVKKGEPEVVKAVEEGAVSVSDAANIVDEPPDVQKEAIEAVLNNTEKTVTEAVRKRKRKDRNGQIVYDDKIILEAYGKLVLAITERRKSMGLQTGDPVYSKINNKLDEIWEAMEEWGIHR